MQSIANNGAISLTLGLLFALTLAGCSDLNEVEKNWAQCQLEAYGPIGTKFQKDYTSFRIDPKVKIDDAYHSFIILCMKSKGFSFKNYFDDNGNPSKTCWTRGEDFTKYSLPDSSDEDCYANM